MRLAARLSVRIFHRVNRGQIKESTPGLSRRAIPVAGADDIDPIEGSLGGDGIGLAREGQARVGAGEGEVLGHLNSG